MLTYSFTCAPKSIWVVFHEVEVKETRRVATELFRHLLLTPDGDEIHLHGFNFSLVLQAAEVRAQIRTIPSRLRLGCR